MTPFLGRLARGVVAMALPALRPLACAPDPPARVPQELLGRWSAQGGPYTGRVLSVDTAFVVLLAGDDTAVAYRVLGVRSTRAPDLRTDHIVLALPGAAPDTLALLRRPSDPDRLRVLDAPGAVWVRQRRE